MATHSAEAAALADVVVRLRDGKIAGNRAGAEMAHLLLFYRLMVRPLLAEPVRTSLTVLAIALGVAVVLAIDLAGFAAAGSFRSSMETLAGDNDLEIVASGGVPESVVGTLAAASVSAADLGAHRGLRGVDGTPSRRFPLIGLDLIAEGEGHEDAASSFPHGTSRRCTEISGRDDSIWVGAESGPTRLAIASRC